MLARVTDVPGFGWRPVDLQPLDVPPVVVHDTVLSTPALTNGLVSIEVDTATATFAITDADGRSASGLGRLVDDGDEGDTYNYSPPAFDSVVDWADSCTVMTLEHGPLRGALLMTARYHWPECIEDGERIRGRDVTVGDAHRAARRRTVRPDHRRARQPVPRPPPAGLVPAGHTRFSFTGRVRVRGGRARARSRGRAHRGRLAHVPVAAVRLRGRCHHRARGHRRVRARRPP